MLLHEFDPNPRAVINPSDNHSRVSACPRVAVSCFERHTFARMAERLGAEPFASNGMANLEVLYYRARYQGKEIALFNAYVGAAGCVCVIECLFALGFSDFRVRVPQGVARLQVPASQMPLVLEKRQDILLALEGLFPAVTLDLLAR